MKTSRIAAAVLVAFVSSSVPLPALAQDDPVTMQARARFKEGVDFYDKGSYENARLAFLQAYALKKHPAVLLNLAQSSAKSGHSLEAAKAFQQYLRESTAATPQQRQDAETGLAEMRQKLGRIEIVAPAGTEITLDDKERLGTTPFGDPIDVETGAHSLRSSNETVRVTALAGQKVQAKFGTGPTVAPVATPVPTAPPPESKPRPAEAPPAAEEGDGTRKGPLPMWPGYVGIGVTGVAIAGTVVFALFRADAQSKSDTVANTIRTEAPKHGFAVTGVCTNPAAQKDFGAACKTLKDNDAKVNTDNTFAIASGVVAGVAGLFTLAWLIAVPMVNHHRAESAGAIKTPILTPYAGFDGSGLVLSGSF